MKRYKWLIAEWPITMPALANKLSMQKFSSKTNNGFIIDRIREDFIEARYIERVEYTDKIIDPFGEEASFERVEYKQCEFRASTYWPGIELLDYPRSIQGLLSGLTEACSFELSIKPLQTNAMEFAKRFTSNSKIDGYIELVQLGSIELPNGVYARATIKGINNVIESSLLITGERKHSIDKVQIKLTGKYSGSILLTSNGAVKIDSPNSESLIIDLRSSLVVS